MAERTGKTAGVNGAIEDKSGRRLLVAAEKE
jgi:hypothetical protein